MLRIKRSVAAAFSQQHFNTTVIDAAAVAAAPAAAAPAADAGAKRKREGDSMAALEAAVAGAPPAVEPLQPGTRVRGFVSAGVIQQGGEKDGGDAAPAAPANPEELDLGEEPEGGEDGGAGGGGEGNDVELQQQAVPEGVFGSLAKRPRTDGGAS